MTPDQISAAAAVVQALGALGAIYFSLKIANDAGKRERAAEAASAARAEAAEQRAEERIQEAEHSRFNRNIDLAVSRVSPLMADLDRVIEEERAKIPTHTGTIWGGYDSKPRQDLERLLTRLTFNIDDPVLGFAVEDLVVAVQKWEIGRGVPWSEFVDGLSAYRQRVENAAAAVEAERR